MVKLETVPAGPLKCEYMSFEDKQQAITLELRAGTIDRAVDKIVDFRLLFRTIFDVPNSRQNRPPSAIWNGSK